jgi:hypothetical protein
MVQNARALLPSNPPPKAASKSPGFIRAHRGKLLASAIITVSIWLMMRKGGLALVPEGGSFSQVKWWTLPAYLAICGAMNYFRAVRWRFLLRSFADVPRRRILAVSWIGFAAILIMPFRLGEFVRPYMIREKGKISLSSATGTVVAERVVDGLYLSLVLAAALILVPTVHPLPEKVLNLNVSVAHVRQSGFVMLGVFTTAFIVIAAFYFARSWAKRLTLLVFGIVSKKLAEKLADTAEKLANGLHFLGRGRDALPFLLETTLYWGLNALGMWLLAWGAGVTHADGAPVSFGETCALMGMLGVTILIPGPPGLLGVFQVGIYAGMAMYFPASIIAGPGAAYVFLLYALQVGWTLASAAFFLLIDRNALKQLSQAEADAESGTTDGASMAPPAA